MVVTFSPKALVKALALLVKVYEMVAPVSKKSVTSTQISEDEAHSKQEKDHGCTKD